MDDGFVMKGCVICVMVLCVGGLLVVCGMGDDEFVVEVFVVVCEGVKWELN